MSTLNMVENVWDLNLGLKELGSPQSVHIILTWYHIPKSNSCHGDETKIKRFEKGPIFIIGKQVASNAEKNGQTGQGQKGHDNIGPNARGGYGNMCFQVFKGGMNNYRKVVNMKMCY